MLQDYNGAIGRFLNFKVTKNGHDENEEKFPMSTSTPIHPIDTKLLADKWMNKKRIG